MNANSDKLDTDIAPGAYQFPTQTPSRSNRDRLRGGCGFKIAGERDMMEPDDVPLELLTIELCTVTV